VLCKVEIRRVKSETEGEEFQLRISGKTALGPSGTGGRDVKVFAQPEAVSECLRSLGFDERQLAAVAEVLHDPALDARFFVVADDVQIPFELLEQQDIDLFD
jgi:hypothetical protein